MNDGLTPKIGLVVWGAKEMLKAFFTLNVPERITVGNDPFREPGDFFSGLAYYSPGEKATIVVTRKPTHTYITCYWNAYAGHRSGGFLALTLLIPNGYTLSNSAAKNLLLQLTQKYWSEYLVNSSNGGRTIELYVHENPALFRPILENSDIGLTKLQTTSQSVDKATDKARIDYTSDEQLAMVLTNLNEDYFAPYQQLFLLPADSKATLFSKAVHLNTNEIVPRRNLNLNFVDSKSGNSIHNFFIKIETNNNASTYHNAGNSYLLERLKPTDSVSVTVSKDGYKERRIESEEIKKWLPGGFKTVELVAEVTYSIKLTFEDSSTFNEIHKVKCTIYRNNILDGSVYNQNPIYIKDIKETDAIQVNVQHSNYTSSEIFISGSDLPQKAQSNPGSEYLPFKFSLKQRSQPVSVTGSQPIVPEINGNSSTVISTGSEQPVQTKDNASVNDPNGSEHQSTGSPTNVPNNVEKPTFWNKLFEKSTQTNSPTGLNEPIPHFTDTWGGRLLILILVLSALGVIGYIAHIESSDSQNRQEGQSDSSKPDTNLTIRLDSYKKDFDDDLHKFKDIESDTSQIKEAIIDYMRLKTIIDTAQTTIDSGWKNSINDMNNSLDSILKKTLDDFEALPQIHADDIKAFDWYSNKAFDYNPNIASEFNKKRGELWTKYVANKQKLEPNSLISGNHRGNTNIGEKKHIPNDENNEKGNSDNKSKVSSNKANGKILTTNDIVQQTATVLNNRDQAGKEHRKATSLKSQLSTIKNSQDYQDAKMRLDAYIRYCGWYMKIFDGEKKYDEQGYKNEADRINRQPDYDPSWKESLINVLKTKRQ